MADIQKNQLSTEINDSLDNADSAFVSSERKSIASAFGQPYTKIAEMVDLLYRAVNRFTYTQNNFPSPSVLFDGSNETSAANNISGLAADIEFDLTTGEGFHPTNGLTYPVGELVISFYNDRSDFTYIGVTITYKDTSTTTITTYTDISTSPSYKVLKFNTPTAPYANKIKIEITGGAGNCSPTSINWLSNRYAGHPIPYINGYLDYNWMYGNLEINQDLTVNGDITGMVIGTDVQAYDANTTKNTATQTLTNKTLTSPKINVTSDATGDIYYRNASGLFTRLPIGTAGQVLTESSGIPSWSDAAGGGGGDMVLLSSTDITTAVSTVDFDNTVFTSDYNSFKIIGTIEGSVNARVEFKVSDDNLSTFESMPYVVTTVYNSGGTSVNSGGTSGNIRLTFRDLVVGDYCHFELSMGPIGDHFSLRGSCSYWESGFGTVAIGTIGATSSTSYFINAIRFLMDSGNITDGNISVYGLT